MARMKITTETELTDRIVSANTLIFPRIPDVTTLTRAQADPYIWEAARAMAELTLAEQKVIDVPGSEWRMNEAKEARRVAQVAAYLALSSGALGRWEAEKRGMKAEGKREQKKEQALEDIDRSGWWMNKGKFSII